MYTYDTHWDAKMIYGCECDAGYMGYDCSLRVCPAGDDPMTEGQEDEVQLLRCDYDPADPAAVFTLSYQGATTRLLHGTDSVQTIQAALEALPTLENMAVSFESASGSLDTLCADGPTPGVAASVGGNIVAITFKALQAPAYELKLRDSAGAPLQGLQATKIVMAVAGASLQRSGDGAYLQSTTSTKEHATCSGRGNCDTATGTCQCYMGYGTSDGRNNVGDNGDCGHITHPITSCPGKGVECSGHGTCGGFPEYQCSCDAGWQAGDCSERVCPFSAAWFDAPHADNAAHADAECSNKGACNRATGKCACEPGFEGEACERMACPGSSSLTTTCNGHGRCMQMSDLAHFLDVNGVTVPQSYGNTPNKPSTWDAAKVYGCLCDAGWQGYDCTYRVCPRGDDSTTQGEPEVQHLLCKLPSVSTSSFKLKFREATTGPILSSASAATIKAALEALSTIEHVSVQFSNLGGLDEACPSDLNTNTISVAFRTPHGDVPALQVIPVDFTNGNELSFLDAVPPAGNLVLKSIEASAATTENDVCSGRGICNHETGECECFKGFGSSDGLGGPGGRGDCGYREPHPFLQGDVPPYNLRGSALE